MDIGEIGMTEDDFQILVTETDGNGDGEISEQDWMRVMTTIVSEPEKQNSGIIYILMHCSFI